MDNIYYITKHSQKTDFPYAGEDCAKASVEPGKIYDNLVDALFDAIKLTNIDSIGFSVVLKTGVEDADFVNTQTNTYLVDTDIEADITPREFSISTQAWICPQCCDDHAENKQCSPPQSKKPFEPNQDDQSLIATEFRKIQRENVRLKAALQNIEEIALESMEGAGMPEFKNYSDIAAAAHQALVVAKTD